MNLPNKITISRILLIPLFLLFMIPLPDVSNNIEILYKFNLFAKEYGNIISAIIFAMASFTDGLDGYIARKYNLVSNLGIFLDPLADKLMVSSALIVLTSTGKIGVLSTILIIAREFIITGFRLVASNNKLVISANMLGKLKTVSQIFLILIALLINNVATIKAFEALTVLITVYSGFIYIYGNKEVLK